jgi:hypothetical protein
MMADQGDQSREGGNERPPDDSHKGGKNSPAEESLEHNKKKSPARESKDGDAKETLPLPPEQEKCTEIPASGPEEVDVPSQYHERIKDCNDVIDYTDVIVWATRYRQTDKDHRFFTASFTLLEKGGLSKQVYDCPWDNRRKEETKDQHRTRLKKRFIKGIEGFPIRRQTTPEHERIYFCLFAMIQHQVEERRKQKLVVHLNKQFIETKKLPGKKGLMTDEEAYQSMVMAWKYRVMYGWHWCRPFHQENHPLGHRCSAKPPPETATDEQGTSEVEQESEDLQKEWSEMNQDLRVPLTARGALKKGLFKALIDKTADEEAVRLQQQQKESEPHASEEAEQNGAAAPEEQPTCSPVAGSSYTTSSVVACPACPQSFRLAAELADHLEAIHPGPMPPRSQQQTPKPQPSTAPASIEEQEDVHESTAQGMETTIKDQKRKRKQKPPTSDTERPTKTQGEEDEEKLENILDSYEDVEDQYLEEITVNVSPSDVAPPTPTLERNVGSIKNLQKRQGSLMKQIGSNVLQLTQEIRILAQGVQQLQFSVIHQLKGGLQFRDKFHNDWEITKFMYENLELYYQKKHTLMSVMAAACKPNDNHYMIGALKAVCHEDYLSLHYYPRSGNINDRPNWLHPEIFYALEKIGQNNTCCATNALEKDASKVFTMDNALTAGQNAMGNVRNHFFGPRGKYGFKGKKIQILWLHQASRIMAAAREDPQNEAMLLRYDHELTLLLGRIQQKPVNLDTVDADVHLLPPPVPSSSASRFSSGGRRRSKQSVPATVKDGAIPARHLLSSPDRIAVSDSASTSAQGTPTKRHHAQVGTASSSKKQRKSAQSSYSPTHYIELSSSDDDTEPPPEVLAWNLKKQARKAKLRKKQEQKKAKTQDAAKQAKDKEAAEQITFDKEQAALAEKFKKQLAANKEKFASKKAAMKTPSARKSRASNKTKNRTCKQNEEDHKSQMAEGSDPSELGSQDEDEEETQQHDTLCKTAKSGTEMAKQVEREDTDTEMKVGEEDDERSLSVYDEEEEEEDTEMKVGEEDVEENHSVYDEEEEEDQHQPPPLPSSAQEEPQASWQPSSSSILENEPPMSQEYDFMSQPSISTQATTQGMETLLAETTQDMETQLPETVRVMKVDNLKEK